MILFAIDRLAIKIHADNIPNRPITDDVIIYQTKSRRMPNYVFLFRVDCGYII